MYHNIQTESTESRLEKSLSTAVSILTSNRSEEITVDSAKDLKNAFSTIVSHDKIGILNDYFYMTVSKDGDFFIRFSIKETHYLCMADCDFQNISVYSREKDPIESLVK